MELPALTSIEGAYWYFISAIVATAVVCALYAAAALLGLVPAPSGLIEGMPLVAPADAVQALSNAVRRSASMASALLGS